MSQPFQFLANAAWLDFVNTEIGEGGTTRDLICGLPDLVDWASAARLVDEAEARRLLRSADSEEARNGLAEALGLRGLLARIAHDLAHGDGPDEADLRGVNRVLASHPTLLSVSPKDGRWEVRSRPVDQGPGAIVALIAADFGHFLEHADLSLVRHCEGKDCRLYFYDTSKNHKRRWCSMEMCGNRAKVAEHRARRHAG